MWDGIKHISSLYLYVTVFRCCALTATGKWRWCAGAVSMSYVIIPSILISNVWSDEGEQKKKEMFDDKFGRMVCSRCAFIFESPALNVRFIICSKTENKMKLPRRGMLSQHIK